MSLLIFLLLTLSPSEGPEFTEFVIPDISLGSFNTRDISIPELLRQISKEKQVNIVADESIPHRLTFQLHDTTLNMLLNFLRNSYGVEISKSGEILFVKQASPPLPKNEIAYQVETGMISFQIEGESLDRFAEKVTKVTGTNLIPRGVDGNRIVQGTQSDLPLERGLELFVARNQLLFEKQEDVFLVLPKPEEKPVENVGAQAGFGRGSNQASVNGIRYENGLYDINVQNQRAQDLLTSLAEQFAIPISLTTQLDSSVSLTATKLEIDSLLRLILAGSKYGFVKMENVFVVGEKTNATMFETQVAQLKHLSADMVEQAMPASLTEGVTIKRLKELNSLLITGEGGKVRQILSLIEKMDRTVPQVLIEVLVVDFNFTDNKRLGVELRNGSNLIFPELDLTLDGFRDDQGNYQIRRLPSNFNLRLRALETQGKAKIISKPHIAALNGHEAEISVGTKQFYRLKTEEVVGDQTPRVRTTERIEEIEASITLKVTPWVTGENEVTTVIEPTFTTFLGQVQDNIPPPISRRNLKSTLRLKNGDTVILGGLIENKDVTQQNGVPFISKLPLLGALFRDHRNEGTRSELVIYLTPHIYYGTEGSVEFIKEREGLDYQLDVKKQKLGIKPQKPGKKRWFGRGSKSKEADKPEKLDDPKRPEEIPPPTPAN